MYAISSQMVEKLQRSMDSFCVPGAGISIFQVKQPKFTINLGIEQAGSPRSIHSNSIFHACSMSKMVTALGVLRLVQMGLLDLYGDVNTYLKSWYIPDSRYTDAKKVTIASLLAHQAGFIDPEGSFDGYREQTLFPIPRNLLLGETMYCPEPAAIKYIPNSEFHYSDTGFMVLELLIEDVTGESFSLAIEKLVLDPLGLRNTFFWNGVSEPRLAEGAGLTVGHDKQGNAVNGSRAHYPNLSGAGLWTTASDMALIAVEVNKSWSGEASSLLSPELTQAMLTGYGSATFVGFGVFLSQTNGEAYFLSKGWGIGYQSMLVSYPRLGCGVVVMTNSEPGKPQEEAFVGEAIRIITEEYNWLE